MVRKIIISALLLACIGAEAQKSAEIINYHPLKFNINLSQSFMLKHSDKDLYLDGYIEYYLDKNISVKGNCIWMIDNRKSNSVLDKNLMILFGAGIHYPYKNHDFYVNIQPGISYTQPKALSESSQTFPARIMPTLFLGANYTLFFAKYCNFFLSAQYNISRYRGYSTSSLNLDYIALSGGLGFQIPLKKMK